MQVYFNNSLLYTSHYEQTDENWFILIENEPQFQQAIIEAKKTGNIVGVWVRDNKFYIES
jgi:hypothetical protein